MADHVEHALGVLSLALIAGAGATSVTTLLLTIIPQRRRIWDTLRGRNVSPASPDEPLSSGFPRRAPVGAGARPTFEVGR